MRYLQAPPQSHALGRRRTRRPSWWPGKSLKATRAEAQEGLGTVPTRRAQQNALPPRQGLSQQRDIHYPRTNESRRTTFAPDAGSAARNLQGGSARGRLRGKPVRLAVPLPRGQCQPYIPAPGATDLLCIFQVGVPSILKIKTRKIWTKEGKGLEPSVQKHTETRQLPLPLPASIPGRHLQTGAANTVWGPKQ